MELILKQPEGKHPFIGILFNNEYQAAKLNQAQVQVNNLFYYKIIFEPKADKIDLTLKMDDWLFTYKYEGLKYNSDKLKRFLFSTMGAECYNFSHLLLKGDNHHVVKTLSTQTHFILKVTEVNLLVEDQL